MSDHGAQVGVIEDRQRTAGTPPVRRTHRLFTALATIATATVATIGYWQWSHPLVFDGLDDPKAPDARSHAAVGKTQLIGMSWPARGQHGGGIHLINAEPHVVTNTAAAIISVHVCTIDPAGGVGSILLQQATADDEPCARLIDARDADLRFKGSRFPEQVVLTVRPTRPGVVSIRGIHLTYSTGWRRGGQDTGIWAKVLAK